MINEEYYSHILDHRKRVIEAWESRLKPIISSGYGQSFCREVQILLDKHDESKLNTTIEFVPYSNYFNDPDRYPKDSIAYLRGWNHHQKTNPHHWQYWVLMEDECNPKINPLPMDPKYVIEMLCDWQSASDYYGNTVHNWYETQKCNMILHPKTVELIEKYLKYMD